MLPLSRIPSTCFRTTQFTYSPIREWKGCIRTFSRIKKCKTDKINKADNFPPKKLPVVLEDGREIMLPVVWDKDKNEKIDSLSKMSGKGSNKKNRPSIKTLAIMTFGGMASGVISYFLYEYYQQEKLKTSKRELYNELNLGNYSDEAVKKLHVKKWGFFKVKDEDLTVDQIYQQLEIYASFGMGTHLNAILDDPNKVDSKSKELTVWDKYKRLLKTIDCGDAGLPEGNIDEVQRCFKLTCMLSAEIEKHEKKQTQKTSRTTTKFIKK